MKNEILMTETKEKLTYKKIFLFWIPLAATWLMMAAEGPFLAAVIARMALPKFNLAAYGMAYSIAVFFEAPVIMLMSSSIALVKCRLSYIKLRNFAFTLISMVTIAIAIFLIPGIYDFIVANLLQLPPEVSKRLYTAVLILLPWPAAIGYRRLYYGILIKNNQTNKVFYCTITRLTSMAITAFVCYNFLNVGGATAGALALVFGVVLEATVCRIIVNKTVNKILSGEIVEKNHKVLSYLETFHFYYPMALTCFISMVVPLMTTFFITHGRLPVESLAVLPLINSLVFVFRSLGLSFQEVSIALLGEKFEKFKMLRNFATSLGIFGSGSLIIIAFTPLSYVWFQTISGLSAELTSVAILPLKIIAIIPGLSVLLNFQRSLMIVARKTLHLTVATSIEAVTIFVVLILLITNLNAVGAVAAVLSLVLGRLAANLYLMCPCVKTVNKNLSNNSD